jgi:tetratricopeptide (TPR) repeat protein
MERQEAWGANQPSESDVMLSLESDTAAYSGQLNQARGLSQRSIEASRRNNSPETAAVRAASDALREAEFGNVGEARKDVDQALAIDDGRSIQILAALALARAGEIGRAQTIANNLEHKFPNHTFLRVYWLPSIRAAIELERKNPDRALQWLQATVRYELGIPAPLQVGSLYPAYLRGLALLEKRDAHGAAGEFQKILDHKGIVANAPTASLAPLWIARAHHLSGDAAGARDSYQRFLSGWKSADPEIPALREANTELSRLK